MLKPILRTGRTDLRDQQGGIALIMLITFMVLAVPTVLAATQVSDQLVRSSMVYENRMASGYAASSGVELGIANLSEELFRIGLVPGGDPIELSPVVLNGVNVVVSVSALPAIGGGGGAGGAGGSRDIVMVLDNSGSIDKNELPYLKDAATAIVDAFDLEGSKGQMAMGLTRFSDDSEGLVEMTANPAELFFGIDSLEARKIGGTNIVAGILGGVAQLSTGLEDRPDVPNVLIFITDGNDSWLNPLDEIAVTAETSGAEIFAIGVGPYVDLDTLKAIAYDPDPADAGDPDAGHVYHTDDFVELLLIIDALVEEVIGSATTASIYVIESVTASGSNVRVYVSVALDGTMTILSYQVY